MKVSKFLVLAAATVTMTYAVGSAYAQSNTNTAPGDTNGPRATQPDGALTEAPGSSGSTKDRSSGSMKSGSTSNKTGSGNSMGNAARGTQPDGALTENPVASGSNATGASGYTGNTSKDMGSKTR